MKSYIISILFLFSISSYCMDSQDPFTVDWFKQNFPDAGQYIRSASINAEGLFELFFTSGGEDKAQSLAKELTRRDCFARYWRYANKMDFSTTTQNKNNLLNAHSWQPKPQQKPMSQDEIKNEIGVIMDEAGVENGIKILVIKKCQREMFLLLECLRQLESKEKKAQFVKALAGTVEFLEAKYCGQRYNIEAEYLSSLGITMQFRKQTQS